MALSFEVDFQVSRFATGFGLLITGDMLHVAREWALAVRSTARQYPPMRPGQRYRRTRDLANNWSDPVARLEGGDVVARLENPIRYTRYVHGNQVGGQQSWFHAGRWKTLRELGDSVSPTLQMRAQAALNARMVNVLLTPQTVRIR